MTRILGAALVLGLTAAATLPVPDPDGREIFLGKGNCFSCHGVQATGTMLGPNLTDPEWLNISGSREEITALVRSGVPAPRRYPGAMPAMGGAQLSEAEIAAVAGYVLELGAPARSVPDSVSRPGTCGHAPRSGHGGPPAGAGAGRAPGPHRSRCGPRRAP